MADVDQAIESGRLFARKSPTGQAGRDFREEVYARLGIPTQLGLGELCRPRERGYRDTLHELFSRHIRLADSKFTIGVFGERELAEFTVLPDLTLQYRDDT